MIVKRAMLERGICVELIGGVARYRVAHGRRRIAGQLGSVFNPLRSAILLIGGEKTGDDRWYERFVPIADRLFERHPLEFKKEGRV